MIFLLFIKKYTYFLQYIELAQILKTDKNNIKNISLNPSTNLLSSLMIKP